MEKKFSFFLLFFLIFGCSEQNNDYFPLEKIKTWNYNRLSLSVFYQKRKKEEKQKEKINNDITGKS